MATDPRDVLTRSARAPDAVVAYGADPEQIGEVWWPAAGPTGPIRAARHSSALLLILHGGFWQPEWDRTHARPMAVALADAGHLVGSVEYRRLRSPGGGGWPDTFDDLAAAVDRLPEMIMAIAPDAARADGVVLIGHSAGGQLALWVAARHRLPAGERWHHAARPRGVIGLAAVSSLARADREGVGDGAVADLLGGHGDEVPERYAIVDPIALAPSGVPTVLVHGSEDAWVPVAQSRSYAAHAAAMGDDVTLVELAGTGHFAVIDPLSAAWPAILGSVRQLGVSPAT